MNRRELAGLAQVTVNPPGASAVVVLTDETGDFVNVAWNTSDGAPSFLPGPGSPTGFAWGYAGGPAQTSLAILADYFERCPDDIVDKALEALGILKDPEGPPSFQSISWREYLAIALHQDFKRVVVAGFPTNERFVLSSDEVAKALELIVQQSRKRESR